jgi:hypothetical protein
MIMIIRLTRLKIVLKVKVESITVSVKGSFCTVVSAYTIVGNANSSYAYQ